MTARALVPPAAEVRRLRAGLAELHRQVAALVDAIDPMGDAEYRRQVAADAYRRGREAGWQAGYERAHRDMEARWREYLAPVRSPYTELEARRWHVCCAECRRTGHRPGCTRCETRTRATFGQPHPDDREAA